MSINNELVSVVVLFFAGAKELTGVSSVTCNLSSKTCFSKIKSEILQNYPALLKLVDTFIIAINQEYCQSEEEIYLKAGDEVAFIPPISGATITQLVADESCGAISTFIGITRDNYQGKRVKTLEYDAYNAMAESELKKICINAREQWELKHIAIHHRLGFVGVKEASVIIAVSSAHRKESLEAVSHIIDALKISVPIWKKEIYEEGDSDWKVNKECFWHQKDGKFEEFIEGPTAPKKPRVHDPINDDDQKVETSKELSEIDKTFIQIMASKEEVDRRIKAFQEMKREELNILNIQEFCMKEPDSYEETSCARTSAVFSRLKGSSTHLKLTKVNNEWGPQTEGIDPGSIDVNKPTNIKIENEAIDVKTESPCISHSDSPITNYSKEKRGLPPALEERLFNMESHLEINASGPVPPSVYARLKKLEDRILHLESISPEYFSTGSKVKKSLSSAIAMKERKMQNMAVLDEIEGRMFALKKKLKEKQLRMTLRN